MLRKILRYCKNQGWVTHYHKDLKAWSLSYDYTAKCWLGSIGIKPINGNIKVTMLGGFCKTYNNYNALEKQINNMMA